MATLPLILSRAKLTNRERIFSEASYWISPATTFSLVDRKTGTIPSVFTRASTATYFDRNGILQTAAVNEPVIEWDPATGACLGWRIWDAVTNLVRQSGAISLSTPWSSQGTAPSITTNAIAAPDNSVTATRVTFAAADSRVTQLLNATLVRNTTYTASVFARPVTAGTLNKVRLAVFDGAAQINGSDITLSSDWQRISFTFTTSATTPSTSAAVQLRNEFSASIANDVYFWGAQLNIGPLAPYVPTGDLTASSTADVASITGAAFAGIWNADESTIVCKFFSDNTAGSGRTSLLFDIGAGGAFGTTGYGVFENSAWFINPAVAPMNLSSAVAVSAGTKAIGTMAARFKANDSRIAVNGTLGTLDSSCAVPASPTTLYIGRSGWAGSANYANGYIQEFATLKSGRPDPNITAVSAS